MTGKVTRDGRVLVWPGGSFWSFDVVSDHGRKNLPHAHHAFQITLSAGGPAHIRTAERLFDGPATLIAPDVVHSIEPEGRIALVFAAPESREGAFLARLLDGRPALGLSPRDAVAGILAGMWTTPRPTDSGAMAIGRQILAEFAGEADEPRPGLDPRLGRVLAFMDAEAPALFSASQAAAIACLSEGRFSHLFVEQIGLPFRTYQLWRRLMVGVAEMSRGQSLTEAAHAAGFADSAHFSRTFNRMFGLPAAVLTFVMN